MLTSMTTIAGLLPIMLERSLQAQVVIPMAASLAFGLLFTTLLVLILVPSFYSIYAKFVGVGKQTVDGPTTDRTPTTTGSLDTAVEPHEVAQITPP